MPTSARIESEGQRSSPRIESAGQRAEDRPTGVPSSFGKAVWPILFALFILFGLPILIIGFLPPTDSPEGARFVTQLASVAEADQANGASRDAALSGDGMFVAFLSEAINLIPDDTNGERDAFVRDVRDGSTSLVSVSSAGEQGNRSVTAIDISADGSVVAFESAATNLIEGLEIAGVHVYVHDMSSGETELAGPESEVLRSEAWTLEPALSADGRFVAFVSNSPNIVPNDSNAEWTFSYRIASRASQKWLASIVREKRAMVIVVS